MRLWFIGTLIVMGAFNSAWAGSDANSLPQRPTRAQSFLGIHFDFHAGPQNMRIGENVTAQMVERIIDKVGPDYIQVDSKGHPGYSSYLTVAGVRAGGFVGDPLRIWREVTARRGVGLYAHHSGVFDMRAVQDHPEWAAIDEKGQISTKNTSVFGPYVDDRLIPQFKELCRDYGLDGVWIDGECWAHQLDYRPEVMALFKKKTGLDKVPETMNDPNFLVFAEICREGFRAYLRHYVSVMHEFDPNFQIASNWAFSSLMPEPVSSDVDFISGDFAPQDSVNTARFDARCLRLQGKPWDLMAWSFRNPQQDGVQMTKSAVQLKQEAAIVVALGGGFQVYFQQKADGSIFDWQMDVMAEVATFCRQRQSICHRATPVPQTAIVFSTSQLYHLERKPFGGWGSNTYSLEGMLRCLLNSQHSVDVLMEHQLKGHTGEYPLIVVPEWKYLDKQLCEELVQYASNGGSLLLIGPDAAALFKDQLGVDFKQRQPKSYRWLEYKGILVGTNSELQIVQAHKGTEVLGRLFEENDVKKPFEVAATIAPCGKGQIAAIYLNLGEMYIKSKTVVARDFVEDIAKKLFPDPLVTVKGSHDIDVAVNRQQERLCINLVNAAGPHAEGNVYTYDDIPAIGPLELTVKSDKQRPQVMLEPGGQRLSYTYSKGYLHITVPKVAIHEIVSIQ